MEIVPVRDVIGVSAKGSVVAIAMDALTAFVTPYRLYMSSGLIASKEASLQALPGVSTPVPYPNGVESSLEFVDSPSRPKDGIPFLDVPECERWNWIKPGRKAFSSSSTPSFGCIKTYRASSCACCLIASNIDGVALRGVRNNRTCRSIGFSSLYPNSMSN